MGALFFATQTPPGVTKSVVNGQGKKGNIGLSREGIIAETKDFAICKGGGEKWRTHHIGGKTQIRIGGRRGKSRQTKKNRGTLF